MEPRILHQMLIFGHKLLCMHMYVCKVEVIHFFVVDYMVKGTVQVTISMYTVQITGNTCKRATHELVAVHMRVSRHHTRVPAPPP